MSVCDITLTLSVANIDD